jgi:hypothetical protein
MNTSQLTVVDENLRQELAAYGLVHSVAEKKAPVSNTKANFFGVERHGEEVEMLFTKDDKILADAVDDGMQLAVVAPENESFDMLLTSDFPKAIQGKDSQTLREFIRRIVDEV